MGNPKLYPIDSIDETGFENFALNHNRSKSTVDRISSDRPVS